MKKVLLILLLMAVLLCGCSRPDYKAEIFSLVNDNTEALTDYIANSNSVGTVTAELSALGIQAVGTTTNEDIVFFELYYTGLYDGGVEYGFYYTENGTQLDKSFSSCDYTLIEQISDNWYYYE